MFGKGVEGKLDPSMKSRFHLDAKINIDCTYCKWFKFAKWTWKNSYVRIENSNQMAKPIFGW